jgi:hypothetical protein
MGTSEDALTKIWTDHEFKPCKVSPEAAFEAKLTDMVAPYVDTLARAAVFSFDGKPQTQAPWTAASPRCRLNRTSRLPERMNTSGAAPAIGSQR